MAEYLALAVLPPFRITVEVKSTRNNDGTAVLGIFCHDTHCLPFFVPEGEVGEETPQGIEFPGSIISNESGPWSSASSVGASRP